MANNYYVFSPSFVPGAKVRADEMNTQLAGVENGFDLLPTDSTSIPKGTTYLGPETGSGNVYSVAMPNTRTVNGAGDKVIFRATHANTAAATIEIDAIGAVALVGPDGAALVADDIASGLYYEAVFDSVSNSYQLLTPTDSYITNAALEVGYAQEWATKAEDSLISTDAGGDGATDYSSLHWAAKSEDSAGAASTSEANAASSEADAATSETNAAISAASINLPTIGAGDAFKFLQVNSGETGYDLNQTPSIRDNLPTLEWVEEDASANNQIWELRANNEQLRFEAVNDARSARTAWLLVNRTANVIDSLVWSGQHQAPAGSEALPEYSFSSDPDTGMYRPAANNLGFVVGSTEMFRINSAGLLSSLVAPSYTALITNDDDMANKGYADLSTVGSRNILINGDFQVWQREVSFPTLGSADTEDITADRWAPTLNGSGEFSVLQSTTIPIDRGGYSFRVDVTTAHASPTTTNVYMFTQRIEGTDAYDLSWGTGDAEDVTLSFYVRSSKTGTHAVSIRNSGTSRSYVATYTVASADTWEKAEITIPGDITGTWLTGEGQIGLEVGFTLGAGPSLEAVTDNTWEGANKISSSSAVNLMDSAANNFYVKEVKLQKGSIATAYQYRTFAEELRACERYYEHSYSYGVYPGATTILGAWTQTFPTVFTTPSDVSIRFRTDKADIPTVTAYDTVGNIDKVTKGASTNQNGTALSPTNSGFLLGVTSTVSGTIWRAHWTAEAKL